MQATLRMQRKLISLRNSKLPPNKKSVAKRVKLEFSLKCSIVSLKSVVDGISNTISGLQNKLSIDEFKEERLAEKLKLTSLETMSKIDSLRDEIEFLKEQQPEAHVKDEIALLENELTGSLFNLDSLFFVKYAS